MPTFDSILFDLHYYNLGRLVPQMSVNRMGWYWFALQNQIAYNDWKMRLPRLDPQKSKKPNYPYKIKD